MVLGPLPSGFGVILWFNYPTETPMPRVFEVRMCVCVHLACVCGYVFACAHVRALVFMLHVELCSCYVMYVMVTTSYENVYVRVCSCWAGSSPLPSNWM